MNHHLAIFVFSQKGAGLALLLRSKLARNYPDCPASLLGPRQLLARHPELAEIQSYADLTATVGEYWRAGCAILFVGAAGIAVRAIASFIQHKSSDVPVLALDAMGNYCVNLLSGHWGGGNELTRQVAHAIGATPVVTTASETLGGKLSLDLLIKEAGGHILDWDELPVAQGRILEGEALPLWDPLHLLGRHELLTPEVRNNLRPEENSPAIAIHWKSIAKCRGLMRVAAPVLHVGLGFRKHVSFSTLLAGLEQAMKHLEMKSIAALATISAKKDDPALIQLAERLDVPIEAYGAEELAAVHTPNPSPFAGLRFGTEPFSVCEAAALVSAGRCGRPCLLRQKLRFCETTTFAVAIAIGHKHA